MKLTIEHDGDEFIVWALLDDGDDIPPRQRTESFVIGTGTTQDEAITSAIRDLERAMGQLEAMHTAGL